MERNKVRPHHVALALMVVSLLVDLTTAVTAIPLATAPRVRDAAVPDLPAQAYGGGEVALELMVAPNGAVLSVTPLRETPPFTDLVVSAVSTWRFAAATAMVEGRATAVEAPVLVLAAFRPPTLYASPAPGAQPTIRGTPSPRLPQVPALLPPSYPPQARGDGVVIVEIEMTRFGAARGYRVVSPQSGFDGAAVDAVRNWRFTAPRDSEAADQMFVYAVLGFRTPVV